MIKKITLFLFILALSIFSYLFFDQTKKNPIYPPEIQPEQPSSLLENPSFEISEQKTPQHTSLYTTLSITSSTPLQEIETLVGKEHVDTVLRINRIDKAHIKTGTLLTIPSDMNYERLSPFPEKIDTLVGIPKIILISQKIQAFSVYENGMQVKWGPISTGKKSTPTPNNLYFANWKAKRAISTSNEEWILNWNINIENQLGISLHQYALPGYPASHSCVRLLEEDAFWLYNWIDQWVLSPDEQTVVVKGTPVLLFGEYDYAGVAPWKQLPENPEATTLSLEEIQNILDTHTSELFPPLLVE
jgi:hypothetical protein